MSAVDIDFEDEMVLDDDEKQYFFFKLGGDTYALEAEDVSEMVEYQSYTRVPKMPSYVKGVTNIRGSIISVIDLLERFGLGESSVKKRTSLVIVNKVALIIDEVDEVRAVTQEDIKDSLDFGFKIEQRFIKKMARYDNEYIAVLNCDEILNSAEISKIGKK